MFAAFLTRATTTDRWVITDTGTGIAATAYYAPERMTDGTWNLYLLAVHPDHGGLGVALMAGKTALGVPARAAALPAGSRQRA